MKKLTLLAVLLFAAKLHGSVGIVQATYCYTTTSATSLTCSFSAAVAAGDTLIAFYAPDGYPSTAYTLGASDSVNGAWTLAKQCFVSSSDTQSAVFYLGAAASGSPTVTMTVSTSVPDQNVALVEMSGLNTSSPLDGTPVCGTWSYSNTTISAPSITTTEATDGILASTGSQLNPGGMAVSSPYSIIVPSRIGVAGEIPGTAGTIAGAVFTADYSQPSFPITIALKAAGSAPVNHVWKRQVLEY